MGWAFGTAPDGREIGYGVVANCDHPGCDKEIDRGLSYVCGGEHGGGEFGCGRYFCGEHLTFGNQVSLCPACYAAEIPDDD